MSYAQVKKGAFCKGYKEYQEKEGKEKGKKEKEKVPSVKLMGPQMCTVCIHYEPDSGFCKRNLTFKRLKPKEVCKGFKRDKSKNINDIETTPSTEVKSEEAPPSKDERINKIVGMIGKEDGAAEKPDAEKVKVPPGQPKARTLCNSCQYYEAESGFCKKYLTYKQLRPGEICKGYKKIKKQENLY